ncbi:DNA-directed RNA polymerase sigma-70 factor (plasmid) [Fulvitalea axinellae]|uniref:DNA-directed RNA polymerase sigma-70 factor n=1 Tax=Fulvitalea axinellae TaxID=1182444 RepID=A0AAU9DAY8_9BACT|nr:DNA-directed RNA polymerase sigma-70 factor [Fulvitalea axinellae]
MEDIKAKLKQRDRSAYRFLFERYYEPLVLYAERFLADRDQSEDLVQEMFLYLWKEGGSLDIRSSLEAYLFRMTRNRSFKVLKKLKIIDGITDLETLERRTELWNMQTHSFDSEAKNKKESQLMEVLNSFPEKMKEIMKLRFVYDYKYKEIAEELGISENTVKTQLKRAKEKISGEHFLPLLCILAL